MAIFSPETDAGGFGHLFRGEWKQYYYIDSGNDVVAVVRWIKGGPALNDVAAKILASIK
jgi:hypothetical protein